MSAHKKIAVNAITQIIGKAVSVALAVITIGIMARYLGPEKFGWYATTITYLQLFGTLIDFGLTLVATQMLSESTPQTENTPQTPQTGSLAQVAHAEQNSQKKILGNLLGLRATSALLFFIIAPLGMMFMPYAREIKIAAAIVSVSFFCISISQIFTGILQSRLAMWWATLAENINRIVLLGAVAAIKFFDSGFIFIMSSISLAALIQTVILFTASKKFIQLSIKFEMVIWKEILKRAFPIAISIVFNLIYLRGDIFTMSLTRTQEEVGLYGAAFRVIEVMNTIPFLFMGVVLPVLAKAWSEKNKDEFNKYLQLSFDVLAFLSFPIAAGSFILATPIMKILGGQEFAVAGPYLNILLFAIIGVYCGAAFSHAIVAAGQQKKTIWIYAINAAAAVCGYILFIPRFGAWAAASITAFNELLVPALIFIVAYKSIRFSLNLRMLKKILLASVFMILIMYPFSSMPLWIPLIIGIIAYAGTSFAIGIIRPFELRALFKLKA